MEPSSIAIYSFKLDLSQSKLSQEIALCLGVGGVGSCLAINLYRSGFKKLILVDCGIVELYHLNSQTLFYIQDVGTLKTEAAKKNLEFYNLGYTEIESYNIDIFEQWALFCGLAKQCTIIFNTISCERYLNLAVQSLCLHLKVPLVMSSISSVNTQHFTVAYFRECGQPCALCACDKNTNYLFLNEIASEEILNYEDIQFLPKSTKLGKQSTVFLNSTCANFMLSAYINQPSVHKSTQPINKLMFIMKTFQSMLMPIQANEACPFCGSSVELAPPLQSLPKVEKLVKQTKIVQHPYLDFFPQRNIFEFNEIVLDSNFETGNLKRVVQVAPNQYDLWIAPDCYQTQYKIPQKAWFRFRVSNVVLDGAASRTIYFTLKNISTNQELNWEGGMVPVYMSKPQNNTWRFIPEPLTKYLKMRTHLEVSFKFEFTQQDEQVHFASVFPYSYSDVINFAAQLEDKYKNDPDIYFHREHLIDSLEGRRLDLLTITGQDSRIMNKETEITVESPIPHLFPNYNPPLDKPTSQNRDSCRPIKFNKKYVLFGARIHPGEHASSYMLQGFIENLLKKDDIVSKALLENFVFVIIPMLNPDGVARGHYRVDTKGIDLNRIYHQAKHDETPGPFAFIEVAKELAREGRLFMVIDFHAHGLEDAAFIYANYVSSQEKRAEIRLFMKLLDIYSRTFDLQKCHYGNDPQIIPPKGGVAKNEIYYKTGVDHIYTLEISYNRGTKDQERYNIIPNLKFSPKFPIPMRTKTYTLGIADFEEVGDSLRHAILELIGLHPCSKIPQTIYRTHENVKAQAEFEERNKK